MPAAFLFTGTILANGEELQDIEGFLFQYWWTTLRSVMDCVYVEITARNNFLYQFYRLKSKLVNIKICVTNVSPLFV